MKTYRDNQIAHHIEMKMDSKFPVLDIALWSSFFYYSYLIKELRSLGETKYPDDLQTYCKAFKSQTHEIAATAISSTAAIKERVF